MWTSPFSALDLACTLVVTSQIWTAFFGVFKGYVQLNLGFLINFEDIREHFHQASRHYAKATRPQPQKSQSTFEQG